jgi:rhamnosyltransferase
MAEAVPLRRVCFYLVHDARGHVDDYVVHKLATLREHVEHIFVVSNSDLTPDSHQRLAAVADTVWLRENVGFDVWAYKTAMEKFGADRLAEYDELILANYTFFAPIFPWAGVFGRMDAQPTLDFWGMTSHRHQAAGHPFGDPVTGELHAHIQSHWIAVRRSMFTTFEFQAYWDRMPMIESYADSIRRHEGRFTKHFSDRGFTYDIAFPAEEFPDANPCMENPELLLERRCPILKRRLFFHESSFLDRHAVLGTDVMARVAETDYPVDLIWRNVTRSAEPRLLHTNMTMLSVLEESDAPAPDPAPRVAVLAHLFYPEKLAELMAPIIRIPVPFDLILTTSTDRDADHIRAGLAHYEVAKAEVRVVGSNAGRSESAFLVTCHDALADGEYDLVLKAHAKSSPQDGYNRGKIFREHTVDNLMSSPGYIARILEMFATDPCLGMVIPPMIHIGYPTLGHSWFTNRAPAKELAKELDINVPFDASTPLAAYGGWFWARPEALAKVTTHGFTFADFDSDSQVYADGHLTHVLERLYTYAALDAGYRVHTVANQRWIAIDYAFLEYKMQRVSSLLPAYTEEQRAYLQKAKKLQKELSKTRTQLKRANRELEALRGATLGRRLARVMRRVDAS